MVDNVFLALSDGCSDVETSVSSELLSLLSTVVGLKIQSSKFKKKLFVVHGNYFTI
jgi:hypothetical protein